MKKYIIILFIIPIICSILISCGEKEPLSNIADTTDISKDIATTTSKEVTTTFPITKPTQPHTDDESFVTKHSDEETSTSTTIYDDESTGAANMELHFFYQEITNEIKDRILGKSYKEDALISLDELRYVQVLHYGFDGETHIGELIVNKQVADDIIAIFEELYNANYPIEKIILVDEYNADDDASMEDNNSSAFNYRTIAGSTNLSKHALGLAIDINPLYNPYITTINGNKTILPSNSKDYVDRSKDFDYKIEKDDICYNAFIKRGWTWGGEWKNSKDYQHFQKE